CNLGSKGFPALCSLRKGSASGRWRDYGKQCCSAGRPGVTATKTAEESRQELYFRCVLRREVFNNRETGSSNSLLEGGKHDEPIGEHSEEPADSSSRRCGTGTQYRLLTQYQQQAHGIDRCECTWHGAWGRHS